MRLRPLVPAALILFMRGPAAAQSWIEYTSREDLWDRSSRYSVTVVDYTTAERIHTDQVRNCQGYPDTCTNHGPNDLRGALDYAVSKFIQRDATGTYYAYADTDRVEGRRIQLTNADHSRTFVAIYMHDNRLYVLESSVRWNR